MPLLTAAKERLQPAGAVTKFNERVKRIGKVNSEIADWLLVWRPADGASEHVFVYILLGTSQGRRAIRGRS